ncbi:MAG: alpha-2-macroglobulin family protein [Pseudomonadota bacterium]
MIRVLKAVVLPIVLTVVLGIFSIATAQERQIILHENSDFYGFDLLTEKDVSLDQCKASCLRNLGCMAFTYNQSARFCFLKSDFGKRNTFEGAIAGRVATVSGGEDIGHAPPLSFVPSYMKNAAANFLKAVDKPPQKSAGLGFTYMVNTGAQKLAAGETKSAVNFYFSALKVDRSNVSVWLKLADAALAHKTNKSSERRTYHSYAVTGGLKAYDFSRTRVDRAAALAMIGRALVAQNQQKIALTAYKQSLELNDLPEERRIFADLREKYGFRVVKHTVDSDSRTPRACIQFSEQLASSGVDYENYVRIDGQPPKSVSASGNQVCVDGLTHGGTYAVTVRRGLPSKADDLTLKTVELDIYVRDRESGVRFTGSNFVLPYHARRGIPLVSVNSTSANLKLFRVGDRALTEILRDSRFLQQLNGYRADNLAESVGEKVWSGSVSIKPELNKEVTTSIPVDEMLPERKPGVYVMTAKSSTSKRESYENQATQWFLVSDIGLTSYAGKDSLLVHTRSLASAKPMGSVELTLIARNNEVLGSVTTDADGAAKFDAGLIRGTGGLAPVLLTAKRGNDDFVFLQMDQAGFDFSDRGVTGRDVPKGIDAYAWTERGIYRPGETVHVAALVRDSGAKAIRDLPLTFIFKRPDGVEERRIVDDGVALGGYGVQLPLSGNAKRGTWNLYVHADTKAPPLFEQRFLVEDFLPERTDFEITIDGSAISENQPVQAKINGKYLYGAPAAGLALEGELVIKTSRKRDGFTDYVFGLADERNNSVQRNSLGQLTPLNETGESTIPVVLAKTASTSRPQTADLVVRMREQSGRAIERTQTISVLPSNTMIGIKPGFQGGQVAEGGTAHFDVIAVDRQGNRADLRGVRWSLVKIERNYQWYRNGSSWRYESFNVENKVADGVVDLTASDAAKLSMSVGWGRYRLDMESDTAGNPASSLLFNAGWYVETKSTDTPDGLEIALDKETYRAGDVARLKVSPRFAGELQVAIGADSILETYSFTVPAVGASFDIPVRKDWGAGAYVLATLFRPGEAEASRMPMRSIGVKWLTIDPEDRALQLSIDAPSQSQPRAALRIPVSVSNLKPGEEAYVTVAAVDVGILNLTNYESPDPKKRYFGQRKLGVAMRDIYGRLIDGSLGADGRLRSGGDGVEGMSTNGSPPDEKLVAFFSGPVRLDENGRAEVVFDIPQFNGTVRIMATAWTAEGLGAAEGESIIRDPVVIAASLPRFMAPGDQARLLAEFTNTDGPAGRYSIDIETSTNISLNNIPAEIVLGAGEKRDLNIPVSARSNGTAWARIALTHENGLSLSYEAVMKVRPSQLPVTNKLEVPLAARNGSILIDENLLAASNLDGAKVSVTVAQPTPFDVPSLVLQLDRYPYGCAEQTTSKALPLLYASDYPISIPGMDEKTIRDRIQKAVARVLSYQSSNGGFSLWGTRQDDLWLTAYVSDFLTRAAEKGYDVPAEAMKLALQNLNNTLAYQNNLEENDSAVAYALYVLARNKKASAGDLRYYSDSQLSAFRSPLSRAQLGAGMALYGDVTRSRKAFESALTLASRKVPVTGGNYTYGSSLRDASAILALAHETTPAPTWIPAVRTLVSELYANDKYTSTQEQAWMLLAARAERLRNADISLDVDGREHSGAYSSQYEGNHLALSPVRIANTSSQNLRATVTTVAVPSQPLPAGGNGLTISRAYYRLDGTQANISDVKQNERFVVVVSIKQIEDQESRLVITDLLPAGFEIDNPRLVSSADLKSFSWLPQTDASHSEFRDDRFVTAFDHSGGAGKEFTAAYVVRAVTPGIYTHPAASVEDMYRPEISARTAAGWMQVRAQ